MAVGTSHNTWIWLSRVEKILLRLWNYCACHAKAGVTFAPERGSHSPLNPLHRTSFRGKCDPTWFRGKCDPRALIINPVQYNYDSVQLWFVNYDCFLSLTNSIPPLPGSQYTHGQNLCREAEHCGWSSAQLLCGCVRKFIIPCDPALMTNLKREI